MKILSLCIVTLVLSLSVFSGCKPKAGEFISMQDAYEAGLLTREDVMEICFRRDGKVYSCTDPNKSSDEWVELEYTSTKTVPELDKKIEKAIKYNFYLTHASVFENEREGLEYLKVSYFGEYNGLYAVYIDFEAFYDSSISGGRADDIVWYEHHDCDRLFRFV